MIRRLSRLVREVYVDIRDEYKDPWEEWPADVPFEMRPKPAPSTEEQQRLDRACEAAGIRVLQLVEIHLQNELPSNASLEQTLDEANTYMDSDQFFVDMFGFLPASE